jgi:hypothetical protein
LKAEPDFIGAPLLNVLLDVLVDQRIVIFMCHVQAVGLSCWLVN